MNPLHFPRSVDEAIRDSVMTRTGRRVNGLIVVVRGETVVLSGKTSSFHIKQLAQHGARDVLPDAPLSNEIVVESTRR